MLVASVMVLTAILVQFTNKYFQILIPEQHIFILHSIML